ncbi:hypothetical protein [Phenylobacterium sp.]|uniref:hypothetical protein n=1 Tax=Phenylobacterium sp. TaxID=1871053 RepID=UPI0008BE8161|nr:hypothetical protein [Phenylobacterium sp.]MBA4793828.1 hypothetical protein [Phenylobacterium sp.]MBC7168029.1 hypothetical protein [Phenylobacterium sp.]OHB40797.1 MAG: hypothetical protein A2882_10040 [Phenylobacterium sp. RIFCSPHIGHO2_01_FULL_70_10]
MARQLDLVGKSGTVYRYTTVEEDRILPTSGANYVIAGFGEDGETRIFYAGETESVINADWRDPLETARQHWSNAEMLLRLNVLRAIREAEQNDLVEAYRPPLNPEPSRRTEGEDSLASPEA